MILPYPRDLEQESARIVDLPETMDVLGVPVSIVNMNAACSQILSWVRNGVGAAVFVREVPSLIAVRESSALMRMHRAAEMIVPDGMPLVWLGRYRGFGESIGRVAGADLLENVCAYSSTEHVAHYFYGGKVGVAEEMKRRLTSRMPHLVVEGTFSPPFRDIDENFEADEKLIQELESIKDSGAAIVWVGLSSPKQEHWIDVARAHLPSKVFIGIGAAFDFHSGAVKRAPTWMQNSGLEWLHRLFSEPKRLWRRYLILAPRFLLLLALDRVAPTGARLGSKKLDSKNRQRS